MSMMLTSAQEDVGGSRIEAGRYNYLGDVGRSDSQF